MLIAACVLMFIGCVVWGAWMFDEEENSQSFVESDR
jgi:hypothetical protein